ncbi:MAG: hypothetical protein JWM96_1116 [Alphaproteobacteria bacterium]|nr:hypothetical protein [Alphaproteobacteria bacterium]
MTPTEPHFDNPEILLVTDDKVACDGGAGPMGHPRVYLPIYPDKGFVDCPYCDRRYVKTDSVASHMAH